MASPKSRKWCKRRFQVFEDELAAVPKPAPSPVSECAAELDTALQALEKALHNSAHSSIYGSGCMDPVSEVLTLQTITATLPWYKQRPDVKWPRLRRKHSQDNHRIGKEAGGESVGTPLKGHRCDDGEDTCGTAATTVVPDPAPEAAPAPAPAPDCTTSSPKICSKEQTVHVTTPFSKRLMIKIKKQKECPSEHQSYPLLQGAPHAEEHPAGLRLIWQTPSANPGGAVTVYAYRKPLALKIKGYPNTPGLTIDGLEGLGNSVKDGHGKEIGIQIGWVLKSINDVDVSIMTYANVRKMLREEVDKLPSRTVRC